MRPALLLALVAPLALGGCLAKTALDVATAPVKIASRGVDLATTSQSEADEARGREIRRREEQLGRLERDYDRQLRDCENGDERACEEARATYSEIRQALPTVPADPGR
jgi:hypothetical protein